MCMHDAVISCGDLALFSNVFIYLCASICIYLCVCVCVCVCLFVVTSCRVIVCMFVRFFQWGKGKGRGKFLV
ncbi:U88 [Trypanosoma cruzi Dm28c]|uniref:U88 n=1 Tax=Trypanosoma cruzi Dm28c TaxID=1416333 RepID=V5C059_TRYCR|nr:U88 [Trypanosoma cruzi Dm28c]